MNIRERYQKLSTSTASDYTVEEIKSLRVDCAKENNLQYLYYCDLLLIEIYNTRGKTDEALSIASKDISLVDPTLFRNIYLSFLDQLIYIYISKKNYKTAYRYLHMKKDYLDYNDNNEVNRWYLESAYVYSELKNKSKALQCLEAITKNNCDKSMLSLVYSNITKLYIDEENIYKAKENLDLCLKYVFEINDEEGKVYCDYLYAKLCVLEKNTKTAIKVYNEMFKSMKEISGDYLSIYLEFINLLIDNDDLDYANKLLSKVEEEYKLTTDKYLKMAYYKTILKIHCYKTRKPTIDYVKLLNQIEVLDAEISENEAYLSDENNEDDQNTMVMNKLYEENNKILNLVNSISCSLFNDNVRNTLIDYLKNLNDFVMIDEAQLVVFDKSIYSPIIELYSDFDKVWTYQTKKERCYERMFTFTQLRNTVFETVIDSKQELSFDLMNYNSKLIDVITQKSLKDLNYNYIVCLPIFDNKTLIGSMLYLSKKNDITSNRNQMILQIANKLLESKLVSLFMQENLRSQKNILNNAINAMQEGLYYFNPSSDEIILSNQAKNFLGFNENRINREAFLNLIDSAEQEEYVNVVLKALNVGESYKFTFHLEIDSEKVLIEEKASPYISKDGNIDFYVCTLSKIDYLVENTLYSSNGILEFNKTIFEIKEKSKSVEYKFTLVSFRVWNLNDYAGEVKELVISEISSIIANAFGSDVYFVDGDFKVICEMMNDLRTIERQINQVLKKLDKGIISNEQLINFKSTSSVVRYPRDSFNIVDICSFSSIILNKNKRMQLFSDELYKQHIKKTSINQIVSEQLKKNDINLLLLELQSKFGKAYEVKFNIRGLTNRESLLDYLDDKVRLEFELSYMDVLFKKIDKIEEDIFVHLSIYTLDYILKNNSLKGKDLSKIVIVIDDFSNNIVEILVSMREFKVRFFINLNVLSEMSLSFLNRKLISGIYINESIDNKIRENILKVFAIYNLFVFANYEYTDYNSVIYRSDNLIEFDDVK